MAGGSSLCASRLRLGKPPRGVGRRRRAIPTIEKGGASRLGAAAPFVSMGRGAEPSGPLTSGDAVAASRRWGGASPSVSRAEGAFVSQRRRVAPESGVRSPSRPYPLVFDVLCCVWIGMNSNYTVGGVGFLQDGLHFFDRISNARPSPQHE